MTLRELIEALQALDYPPETKVWLPHPGGGYSQVYKVEALPSIMGDTAIYVDVFKW